MMRLTLLVLFLAACAPAPGPADPTAPPDPAAPTRAEVAAPLVLPCDKVTTVTSGGAQATVLTYWYAELELAAIDPTAAPEFSASACDWEYFGAASDPLAPCASGSCTKSGYSSPAGALPCSTVQPFRVGPGRALFACGQRYEIGGGMSGQRAKVVYARVNQ